MLLEEAILFLLRGSGYSTVDSVNGDPTLTDRGGLLCVRGRGTPHQIDAIADFRFPPPFGNPHRLLVEAKLIAGPVGIDVVRNALGVYRDVCEYWVPPAPGQERPQRPRHHYQYAVFSARGFTRPAQDFAFAQDIYLLTLEKSPFLQPVVAATEALADLLANAMSLPGADIPPLSTIRGMIRSELMRAEQQVDIRVWALPAAMPDGPARWGQYIDSCRAIGFGLLGMLQSRLPILLVPREGISNEDIQPSQHARIHWDTAGWYLRVRDRELFSFSLPGELREQYEQSGLLTAERALDLKHEQLGRIIAVQNLNDGSARFIEFVLDGDWLAELRRGHD